MDTSTLKANKKNILTLLYMGVMPLLCSTIITTYAFQYQEVLDGLSVGAWVFIGLVSVLTMGIACTPTTFVAIITGYFLGMYGLLIVVPAYIGASVLGFYLGKKIDGGTFLENFDSNNKRHEVLEGLKKNEFLLIVMARLSPALPFAIMNVVLSISGASLSRFILAGTVGMLPRTVLSVYLGSQSRDLMDVFEKSGEVSWEKLLIIGFFILSTLGIVWGMKRALKSVNSK